MPFLNVNEISVKSPWLEALQQHTAIAQGSHRCSRIIISCKQGHGQQEKNKSQKCHHKFAPRRISFSFAFVLHHLPYRVGNTPAAGHNMTVAGPTLSSFHVTFMVGWGCNSTVFQKANVGQDNLHLSPCAGQMKLWLAENDQKKLTSSKCNGKFHTGELGWNKAWMLLTVTVFKILKTEFETQW